MRLQDRITADPKVCHGKPCIRGTRVLVSVILAEVAAGGYHISREDIEAVLQFAAERPSLIPDLTPVFTPPHPSAPST
jgi:uncharacterized protein (DUF433 family)